MDHLDDRQESRQRLVTAWQNYCETGDHLDPSSPIKRTVRIPSVDDEDVLPLPDGAFTTNIGLDMVVVVTKVRMIEMSDGVLLNPFREDRFRLN